MSKRILIPTLLSVLLIPGIAGAGVDPLTNVWAEMLYDGPGSPALYNLPDGGGRALTEARLPDGTPVDATIVLHMLSESMDPVVGFPAEDVWLFDVDGGVVPCLSGTIADAPTDAAGDATWTRPLRAGGSSAGLTLISVGGSTIYNTAGFALRHNSADINGDLQVNLADVGIFATDYTAAYSFRSDFSADGMINLTDVSYLAAALGSACP